MDPECGAPRRKPVLLAAGLAVLVGVAGAVVLGSPAAAAGGAVVALCGAAVFLVEVVGQQGFRLRMARLPLGSGWRLPAGR
jgi:ABC-type branched-subunit amino acid transport system permease subunit